jgi:hypothetical protein
MPNETESVSGDIKQRLKVFGYWVLWVNVVFFTVYPFCNFLTSKREFRLQLYLPAELEVPFISHFVWLYMSMYLLFLLIPFCVNFKSLNLLGRNMVIGTIIAGLIFLILPTESGFLRIAPESGIYSGIFSAIFKVDLPHNMVPSLHVVYCGLILLTMAADSKTALIKSVYISWLILICLSTVFVHQHHILDIVAGLVLAVFLRSRMTAAVKQRETDNLNSKDGE